MSRYESLTILDFGVAPVHVEATYAAGLGTVASLGVAVKLVAVTTQKGDGTVAGVGLAASAGSMIVGVDNTFELVTGVRKLLRVQGRFHMDVAAGADLATMHIFVNGVSVFETAAQNITAGTPLLFEFDQLLAVEPNTREFPNAGKIEIFVENEDTTANLDTVAFAETAGIPSAVAATDTTVLTHGWVKITG